MKRKWLAIPLITGLLAVGLTGASALAHNDDGEESTPRETVAAKVAEIVANGGLKRSEIWDLFPDEKVLVCYCEDPFGNVLEIISQRYEQALANRN